MTSCPIPYQHHREYKHHLESDTNIKRTLYSRSEWNAACFDIMCTTVIAQVYNNVVTISAELLSNYCTVQPRCLGKTTWN